MAATFASARVRPRVDWEFGERLFLHGEESASSGEQVFPSLAEIARRLGVTKQAAHKHARQHGWLQQRAQSRGEVYVESEPKARRSTRHLPVREERPRTEPAEIGREPLAVIEAYIARFAAAIDQGRVRFDSVAEFDKAVRLRRFLLDEQRTPGRQQVAGVTLEELQRLHAAARQQDAELAADPALTGVTALGGGYGDDGEAGA